MKRIYGTTSRKLQLPFRKRGRGMLPMKKAESLVKRALGRGKRVVKNPHWSKDYAGQPAPWQRFRERTKVIGETKEATYTIWDVE